jgi:hypothetical protein
MSATGLDDAGLQRDLRRPQNSLSAIVKFFSLLILPQGININDTDSIESAAATMMKPFRMWEDDVPAACAHWDYY